jgi:cell division protein FtsI (penicillin-binding protein 3)
MQAGKGLTIDSRRLTLLVFGIVLGVTVVTGRLVYYQIFRHDELKEWSADQCTWEEPIPARRGDITDINGHLLALDTVEWDVSVSPPLVTGGSELAGDLSGILGIPQSTVQTAFDAKAPWFHLARGVDYEVGKSILELDANGVTCDPEARRFYPEGSLFAHLVGIVNTTGDGFYGVEGYHNLILRGAEGKKIVEKGPTGNELPLLPVEEIPSMAGTSLVLTVDRNIQWIAQEELRNALKEYEAESGTVLIMDPQTGAILADVSYPSFDPNDFVHADPDLLADPAVSDMWEPGSIFKIVTWAAALDAGVISPGTTFYDEGALEVGGRVIRNWNRQGNGLVTMTDGLVKSLNTVASFISTSMGKETFYTYLRRFGLGILTEVDLDSEGPGMIKLPGDSHWFPSELGTNSFGQGIAVTPMQMIVAVSAVANRGTMMKPYIVHELIGTDVETGEQQVVQVQPMVVRRAISQETAGTLTSMLVEVVDRGATEAQVPGYRIAGKTGTAQVPTPYGYHDTDTIASFVGYAPAEDPQFIVLVKLDKPRTSPWGSQTAAPTFSAIAERLFAYMQIPPDEIRLAERP